MRQFCLFIALCLWPLTALAVDSLSRQNNFNSFGQQYAQAHCPASNIAQVLKLPKRASERCKDAFKEMRYSCHLVETCDDCEKATAVFDDVCNIAVDLNSDNGCETDSDCALVDTDCNTRYDPTPLNRFKTLAARRRNGWPIEACMRSQTDKDKFHAVCIKHTCQVQKDD